MQTQIKKKHTLSVMKRKTILLFGVMVAAVAVMAASMAFMGCTLHSNHDYQLVFLTHSLERVTVREAYSQRITPATFTPSAQNTTLDYQVTGNNLLPQGLSLTIDAQGYPVISGTIMPEFNVRIGLHSIRISVTVQGTSVSKHADFNLFVDAEPVPAPEYSFTTRFLETPAASGAMQVSLEIDSPVQGSRFLEARVGELGAWLPFAEVANVRGVTLPLTRNSVYTVYVRYAQTAQAAAGDVYSMSISTRYVDHQPYFFIMGEGLEQNTLMGFSSFFIAYYTGNAIILPQHILVRAQTEDATATAVPITSVAWQALAGFANNQQNGQPRFPAITVGSHIEHVVGRATQGMHYRQVIIFESTTPPSFTEPFMGAGIMHGGRFVVPNVAHNAYRAAISGFIRIDDHIFTHSEMVASYDENGNVLSGFLIRNSILFNNERFNTLKVYFGNDNLVMIPAGVEMIAEHAFLNANQVRQLVMPRSLEIVRSGAFVLEGTNVVQTIFHQRPQGAWNTHVSVMYRNEGLNATHATILFYSPELPSQNANQAWFFADELGQPAAQGTPQRWAV